MRRGAIVTYISVQVTLGAVSLPWGPVPEGWIYLEREGIDTWSGVFHDRVSGACVYFDVAFPFVIRPVGRSKSMPPSGYSGVRVNYVEETSETCSEGRKVLASFFPEEGDSGAGVWNVSSDTCGTVQRERVHQFLFLAGGQPRELAENPELGRRHARSELESIEAGRSFLDVREQLGETSSAECHADGGFTAVWTEDSLPHYRDWEFRFNRDQKLVAPGARQ